MPRFAQAGPRAARRVYLPEFRPARVFAAMHALSFYPPGFQPTQTRRLESDAGFSNAMLWRLETAAGPLCLRAMPAGDVYLPRLSGLHRLLGHIANQHVPVAAPLATSSGATFVEAEGSVWQLEPWLPGTADYWQRPSPQRLRAAMQTLARWHAAAASFCPTGDEAAWFSMAHGVSPTVVDRQKLIAAWTAPRWHTARHLLAACRWPEFRELGFEWLDLFARVAPGMTARLKLAERLTLRLQPCLRDVWHDHVLYTGDEVTGVIDPHACRSDHVAVDLARLLGSFVGDDRQAWDAGVAAYAALHPLSVDEFALLALLDQSGVLLSGLTWIDRVNAFGPPHVAQGERILARFHRLLTRLKHLAAHALSQP